MNDTELYEIVKDVPRELWPDGLTAEPWGNWEDEEDFEESWYWGIDIFFVKGAKRTKDSARMIATDHALLLWEGALSRFVSETYYEEPADKHGIRWFIWHHEDWTRRPEYPTRIHALVAAAIERYRSMENDKKDARA